ncbi:MAG: helicase-associated domain-containing protein, partial [Dehalococcoidia bacterium]
RTLTLSATALRRALDAGMKPQAVRKALEEHAAAPLPPTVERLFADVSDKYGRIHVGQAGLYLTVDDPHLLVELQADKRLSGIRLHSISDTVAIVNGSSLPQILDSLRGSGHMPVADGFVPQTSAAPPKPALAPTTGRKRNEWLDDDVAMQLLNDPAVALATLGLGPNGRPLAGGPGLRIVRSGTQPRSIEQIPGADDRVSDKPTIAELMVAAVNEQALIEMEYIARVKGSDHRRQLIVEPFELMDDTVWATDQATMLDKSYKLQRIAWARVVND